MSVRTDRVSATLRVWPPVVFGGLAIVAGIRGYQLLGFGLAEAAYATVGAFALTYPQGVEVGALIHLSRALAILVSGAAIAAAVGNRTRASWERWRISRLEEHVLIVGAENYGAALARTWHQDRVEEKRERREVWLKPWKQRQAEDQDQDHPPPVQEPSDRSWLTRLKRTPTEACSYCEQRSEPTRSRRGPRARPIVLMERDPTRAEVAELRADGVLVSIGDAKQQGSLLRASAQKATWIFIFLSRLDAAEAVLNELRELAAEAHGTGRAGRAHQRVVVHVQDPRLAHQARLRLWREEAAWPHQRIDVASVPENVAQHLLALTGPDGQEPTRGTGSRLLVGDGDYVTAALNEIRSQAAGQVLTDGAPPEVMLVGSEPAPEEASSHDDILRVTRAPLDDADASGSLSRVLQNLTDVAGGRAPFDQALFLDATDRGLSLALTAADRGYVASGLAVVRESKLKGAFLDGDSTRHAPLQGVSTFVTGLTEIQKDIPNIKNTHYSRMSTSLLKGLGSKLAPENKCGICHEALLLLVERLAAAMEAAGMRLTPIVAATTRSALLAGAGQLQEHDTWTELLRFWGEKIPAELEVAVGHQQAVLTEMTRLLGCQAWTSKMRLVLPHALAELGFVISATVEPGAASPGSHEQVVVAH